MDYSAKWKGTVVKGKYVDGWIPPLPGEGPDMKDCVVHFIFENTQSDWWVFLYLVFILITLTLITYFRTQMKEKVIYNENVSLNLLLWNKQVFHLCSFFLVGFLGFYGFLGLLSFSFKIMIIMA